MFWRYKLGIKIVRKRIPTWRSVAFHPYCSQAVAHLSNCWALVTFCVAIHVFGTDGDKDLKFGRQTDRSKFKPTDDKPSIQVGVVRVTWPFLIVGSIMSLERVKLGNSNLVCRLIHACMNDHFEGDVFISGSRFLFNFWEITDNVLEKVQGADIVTRLTGNHMIKSDLGCQLCCLKAF